eukprot:m.356120 g.356120  ORF g.356120 m.356120 type:complete len:106 (+) comp17444_c0_seq1:390-707(+)
MSAEALAKISREIKRDKTIHLEERAQAKPPSKNYHQVLVNSKGVVFRTWKIDPAHGCHGHDPEGSVEEKAVTFADFIDGELNDSVLLVFGQDVLDTFLSKCREIS